MSKLNILTVLAVFGASLSLSLQAMEQKSEGITPQNLASQLPELSTEEQEAINAFRDEYGHIWKTCNNITSFKNWRGDLQRKNDLLASNGLVNKDNPNWGDIIVNINDNQEAELAGMINRRQNILQYYDVMTDCNAFSTRLSQATNEEERAAIVNESNAFLDKHFATYQSNPVDTYQNMSNAAHAVLLYKAKKDENLHRLHIPSITIAPFNVEDEGKPANDDLFFIVRKQVKGVRPAQAKDFTPEIVRQLLLAVKYSYIYSLGDSTKIVVREDGDVVLPWIKQPNATNVSEFFGKDMERSKMRSIFAMQDIVARVKDNKEAFAAAQAYIRQDLPYLQTCKFHENLLKDAGITL